MAFLPVEVMDSSFLVFRKRGRMKFMNIPVIMNAEEVFGDKSQERMSFASEIVVESVHGSRGFV